MYDLFHSSQTLVTPHGHSVEYWCLGMGQRTWRTLRISMHMHARQEKVPTSTQLAATQSLPLWLFGAVAIAVGTAAAIALTAT